MYKYQVGTPDGPFTITLEATDEKAAVEQTEKDYGEVQDGMEWSDERGTPVMLLIVLK